MSQERTRFPITPQDRHRTARSFDDVRAVPEEHVPRQEDRPQDKPAPPAASDDTDEHDAGDQQDVDQADVARSSRQTGGDGKAAGSIEERETVATDGDDLMDGARDDR